MNRQITLEEIDNATKDTLIRYCEELKVKYKRSQLKSHIQDLLRNKIEKEDNVVYRESEPNKTEGLFSVENEQDDRVDIPRTEDHFISPKFYLGVTIDELIQYWQRGYICHPKILDSMMKESSVEHRSSDLTELDEIDLSLHQGSSSIVLSFDPSPKYKVLKFTTIIPLSRLNEIQVFTVEDQEIVSRSLINTNYGFDSGALSINLVEKPRVQENSSKIKSYRINSGNEEQVINDLKFIDSWIGGIAISGFLERSQFLDGEHFKTNISRSGIFYEGIFGDKSIAEQNDKRLVDFIIEKSKLKIKGINNGQYEYLNELFDDFRDQNDSKIETKVLENLRFRTPENFETIMNALEENMVRKAIDLAPKRPLRDPFFLFYALLNQFSNTKVGASSDRQSFLFAIQEFYSDGSISQEELLVLAFFLGHYIGYSRCWEPVERASSSEWREDQEYRKLLLTHNRIEELLSTLLPYTNINSTQANGNGHERTSNTLSSTISDDRNIIIKDDRMELYDDCYLMFKKWKDKGSSVSLLNMVMFFRQNKDFMELTKGLIKGLEEKEMVKSELESVLLKGGLNKDERAIIKHLIALDK